SRTIVAMRAASDAALSSGFILALALPIRDASMAKVSNTPVRMAAATSAVICAVMVFGSRRPNTGLHHVHEGRKKIPAKPHRLDQMRVTRVQLNLLPDTADVDIDRSLDRPGQPAMGQFEQLIPRQDPSWTLTECREQLKLRTRHRDASAVHTVQSACVGIQAPSGEVKHARSAATRGGRSSGAAQ